MKKIVLLNYVGHLSYLIRMALFLMIHTRKENGNNMNTKRKNDNNKRYPFLFREWGGHLPRLFNPFWKELISF